MFPLDDLFSLQFKFDDSSSNLRIKDDIVELVNFNFHIFYIIKISQWLSDSFGDIREHE